MERRNERFWKKRIDEQKKRGLSATAYCRNQGLAINTFLRWRKRFANAEREPQFVEVLPKKPEKDRGRSYSRGSVLIRLPNGIQILFRAVPDKEIVREVMAGIKATV